MLQDVKMHGLARKSNDMILRLSDVEKADKGSTKQKSDCDEVPSDEEGHSMI
jgi:hypothetical protein